MHATPPPNQQDPIEPEAEFDAAALYHAIRERFWLLIGCLVFTCGLGALYIVRTPKTYTAQTIIQVEQSEHKIVDIQDVANEDLKAAEQLKTIEQTFSSLTLLQGVVERLKLTPEQLGLPPRVPPDPPYVSSELAQALQGLTSAKLQKGTRMISITSDNRSPELAQQLADEVVKQYMRDYIEQRVGVADYASKFLVEERDRLKQVVQASEQMVQAYKDAHPDIPLDDSQALMDNRMLSLNNRLNDALSARFKLEADYTQVQQFGQDKTDQLLTVSSVAQAQAVLTIQKDLSAAESDFAALTERYKPRHPKYIQAERQLQELRNVLRRTVAKAAEGVGSSLQAARDAERQAQALVKNEEKARLAFGKVSLPYESLTKDLENNRELYNSLQRRLKETEVTKSMEQDSIRVIQPAFLPLLPSKPKAVLVIIASALSGLLLGGVLAFALNAANQSFKTVDQVEQELGVPALGTVPKAAKASLKAKAMLTVQEPNGVVAEAFRSMRASLSLLGNGTECRSVLFSSAIPGEGKTFCSVNYGVSLAQLGQRTLIIDGDLRLPTVHKLFFDEPPEIGVSSVLLGEVALEKAASPTGIDNLYVLAAGRRADQPAELLAKGAFSKLLKEALSKYDRVVVDSAPIHAVSDTLLMLKDVETVCLVIHASKTPRRVVSRALHKITEANGDISGVILNQLLSSNLGYYYHYSTGEYGKGVYGAEPSKS